MARNVTDPMDHYSHPKQERTTELAHVFRLEPRRKPNKPGRALVVTYDERFPLFRGFSSRYSYLVKFDRAGDASGSHYHNRNTEIMFAVYGSFDVFLEDPRTKRHESVQLRADRYEAIVIQPGIAHRIVSKVDGAILVTHASGPHTEADETAYSLF